LPSDIKANPDVVSACLGEDDETSPHDDALLEKSAHA
jgi:branched-chain amino acid transport system ATP-binding protein